MGSGEGTAEERKESARILECDLLPQAQDLLRALHRYRHSQDEVPAIQTHHLIRAYVLGIRTLIYVCLQSPKQNDSAKYAISLSLQHLVGQADRLDAGHAESWCNTWSARTRQSW